MNLIEALEKSSSNKAKRASWEHTARPLKMDGYVAVEHPGSKRTLLLLESFFAEDWEPVDEKCEHEWCVSVSKLFCGEGAVIITRACERCGHQEYSQPVKPEWPTNDE